jgi:pimeloyl-ACP methyl ester carboxylesterase
MSSTIEIVADGTARGDVDTPDADDGPRARFARAYADAVARWPVPVTAQTAATDFGATHVLACGAGPAVVLLPGGGATAVAWAGVAAELSRGHRVVAVDPVGQPGLSTTPVLVLMAGRSQAHDPGRVAARAAGLLPDARVATVATATHHTMPTEDVPELAGHIQGFLA